MYLCTHDDCAYHCCFTDTCDYYLLTGRRRGCPAAGCVRYEKRTADYPSETEPDSAAFDPLMQALYAAGLNDRQIAAELGLNRKAVRSWRRQARLPAQRELAYT